MKMTKILKLVIIIRIGLSLIDDNLVKILLSLTDITAKTMNLTAWLTSVVRRNAKMFIPNTPEKRANIP